MANDSTPSNGLLQDTPVFPVTSPYPFGSPQYQELIAPYLTNALQAQAERAANARGEFYSGPAMADELQAASNVQYQMAQQGAQQAANEQTLQEQQAFAEQQQKEQEQAQAQIAAAQNAAGNKSAIYQGIGGMVGPFASLYAAKQLGWLGNGAPAAAESSGLPYSIAAPGVSDPGGALAASGLAAPATDAGLSVSTDAVPYALGGPAGTDFASAMAGEGGMPLASAVDPVAASGLEAPVEGSSLAAYVPAAGMALGGGLGALAGYQFGGGSKSGVAPIAGGALGGLGGFAGGMALAPVLGPIAPIGGAFLGSAAGRQLGNWANGRFAHIGDIGKWRF